MWLEVLECLALLAFLMAAVWVLLRDRRRR